MFKTLFSYKNPEKLEQALMRTDTEEKYNQISNDLNIKQTVLRDQIKTKTGVSRTRLENLVNFVKDNLDRVRLYDNTPDLESKKFAKQRRNQQGQALKMLTSDQMLSRLLISLAQLNAKNNSKKLKNEIRQLLYSLYRSKKFSKNICKSLIDII